MAFDFCVSLVALNTSTALENREIIFTTAEEDPSALSYSSINDLSAHSATWHTL